MVESLLNQIQAEFDVGALFELELAVEGGREAVVRYLLEELNCLFDASDPENWALLYRVSLQSIIEEVQVSEEPSDQDIFRNDESTVIFEHLASQLTPFINEPEDGYTPLGRAVEAGNIEAVRCLLDHGAQWDNSIPAGVNWIDLAVEGGNLEIARLLLEELQIPFEPDNPDDRQAMYAAARRGTQVFRAFLSDDPEYLQRKELWRLLFKTLCTRSNMMGKDHRTPLTRAIARRDVRSIEELVKRLEADVNQADGEGFLPLTRAAATQGLDAEAIEFLLNKADPNLLDPEGWTALTQAVSSRNYLMVALLVRHRRTDVNQPNGHAETALWLAVNAADLRMIGILADERRLNIDQADETGRTALYHAIARGDKRTALYLLEKGANPDAVDREGITPLHRAAFRAGLDDDGEILQHFLARSHHRDQADHQGRTPAAWKEDGARERLELMQESEEEVEEKRGDVI